MKLRNLNLFSFLLLPILLLSCSDNSEESVPITDLYPLEDGYKWDYQLIDQTDTTDFFVDFDKSQLSDNSELAVLELVSLESIFTIGLAGKKNGICLELISSGNSTPNINLNTLGFECAALLRYPIKSGASYSYSYTTSEVNYSYNVEVSVESIALDFGEYEVYKFVIPSVSNPNQFVNEVYYSPEIGIVLVHPEYEIGTDPVRSLVLVNINF